MESMSDIKMNTMNGNWDAARLSGKEEYEVPAVEVLNLEMTQNILGGSIFPIGDSDKEPW